MLLQLFAVQSSKAKAYCAPRPSTTARDQPPPDTLCDLHFLKNNKVGLSLNYAKLSSGWGMVNGYPD